MFQRVEMGREETIYFEVVETNRKPVGHFCWPLHYGKWVVGYPGCGYPGGGNHEGGYPECGYPGGG